MIKYPEQKGIAYVIVLFFILLISASLFALSTLATNTSLTQNRDFNLASADLATESALKVALGKLNKQFTDLGDISTTQNIAVYNSSVFTLSNINNRTVQYSYNIPAFQLSPTNLSSNQDITITANATVVNGTKTINRTANAKFTINRKNQNEGVPLTDFLRGTITYSKNQNWNISYQNGNPQFITPPDATSWHQVKFDPNFAVKSDATHLLKFAFNASCKDYTWGNTSGYGIYYGMSNTPDNPDGYVFQYDPGAGSNGSFFVKRVVARNSTPSDCGQNEWTEKTVTTTDNKGKKTTTTTGYYYNSDGTSYDGTKYNKSGDGCATPFQPNNTTTDDLVRIDLKGVNGLEQIMKNNGYPNFDFSAPHTITIEVIPNPNGATLNPVHRVSCDGIPILHFVDHTTRVIKDFSASSGRTVGLRVWGSTTNFIAVDPTFCYQAVSVTWQKPH